MRFSICLVLVLNLAFSKDVRYKIQNSNYFRRKDWISPSSLIERGNFIFDMLFTDKYGKFHIYDWKRSKEIVKSNSWFKFSHVDELSHIPDTNYWHYCLQLNTYKAILQRKYNIVVDSMFLVCFHPENKVN